MSMLKQLFDKRDTLRVQIRRNSNKQLFSNRRKELKLGENLDILLLETESFEILEFLQSQQPFAEQNLDGLLSLLQNSWDLVMSTLNKNGKQISDIGLDYFHKRQGAMIIAQMAQDPNTKAYLIEKNTVSRCLDRIKDNTDKTIIMEYMFVLQRLTADIVDINPNNFKSVAASLEELLKKGGNTKQFQLLISHLSNWRQLIPKTDSVIRSVFQATLGKNKVKKIAACATVTRIISMSTAAQIIPYMRQLIEACRMMVTLEGNNFFHEKGKKSLSTLIDKVGEDAAAIVSENGLLQTIVMNMQGEGCAAQITSVNLIRVFVSNQELFSQFQDHLYIIECLMDTCLVSYDPALALESLKTLRAIFLKAIKSRAVARLMCSLNYDKALQKACTHINQQVSQLANMLYDNYFLSCQK